MNKDRRAQINKLHGELSKRLAAFKAGFAEFGTEFAEEFADLRNELDQIKSDEEEYRDNIPESMQGGEKYETADNAIAELESAYEKLDTFASIFDNDDLGIEALSEMEECLSQIDNAGA